MASIITKDFIYIHPPKTGGTSFSNILANQLHKRKDVMILQGHGRYANFSKRHDTTGKLILATVRNPWDRFFSLWNTRNTDLDFIDYTHAVVNRTERWYATKPQMYWIPQDMERVHLIRYENYNEEVVKALKMVGLKVPKEIPWLRKTEQKSRFDYRSTFNCYPLLAEMLGEYYKIDCELLNYSY